MLSQHQAPTVFIIEGSRVLWWLFVTVKGMSCVHHIDLRTDKAGMKSFWQNNNTSAAKAFALNI